MVRYWCATCNEEHDNASECPSVVILRGVPGKGAKKLRDHQRRAQKADYRAPKGASNAVNDGCAVTTLALLGAVIAIPVGVWYLLG